MKQLLASINFNSQRSIHGTYTNRRNRPVIEINWVYLKFAKSQLTRLAQNTPVLQDLQHGGFYGQDDDLDCIYSCILIFATILLNLYDVL